MYSSILAGIGGGRVLTTAGSQSAKTSHTYIDVFTVAGQSLVTGSFAASRVAKLKNPKQINCGVKEYNHAWRNFPQLINMEITYRPIIQERCGSPYNHHVLDPSLLPDVAKARMIRLMGELRTGLACLLIDKEGKQLDRELRLMKKTMGRRLELTEEIMEALAENKKNMCQLKSI